MFFIILTTASTLHVAGQTNISTAKEAAEALRPLAGSLAYLLFTIGIVGTGLLAVPVLCGSAAYAVCEAENWSGSLADRPRISRRFYGIIGVAMMFGLARCLPRNRRDEDALLFGGAEWCTGSAANSDRYAADE